MSTFTYVINGLTVVFQDTTSPTPTSRSWNFGDDSAPVTTANPTHIYSIPGVYTVSLVTTLEEVESEPFTQELIIVGIPSIEIPEIVSLELPASVAITESLREYYLLKWKLYLQSAFELTDEQLYNPNSYNQLQKMLLGKLVAYDRMLLEAQTYMASSMGSGGSSEVESEITINTPSGAIKKIEVGPTKTEWYAGSEILTKFFARNPQTGQSVFEDLTSGICLLAKKLKVKLPMCSMNNLNPVVPQHVPGVIYVTSGNYIK
jgi:PKD repeat protein